MDQVQEGTVTKSQGEEHPFTPSQSTSPKIAAKRSGRRQLKLSFHRILTEQTWELGDEFDEAGVFEA